jgi:hypothetical protein
VNGGLVSKRIAFDSIELPQFETLRSKMDNEKSPSMFFMLFIKIKLQLYCLAKNKIHDYLIIHQIKSMFFVKAFPYQLGF